MGNPANEYRPLSETPRQQAHSSQIGGPPTHHSESTPLVSPQHQSYDSTYDRLPRQDSDTFVPPQQQPQDSTYYSPPLPDHDSYENEKASYQGPSYGQPSQYNNNAPGQGYYPDPMTMHPHTYQQAPPHHSSEEQYEPSSSQTSPNHSQGQQISSAAKAGAAWKKTKKGGKQGFDQLWNWGLKLGGPVNNFTNKIGSEAFWPTTMDKESDKAARILKSFCKDGFYSEPPAQQAQQLQRTSTHGPKAKQRVLVKIPQKVIQNAVGLAIFSTMRTGMWISGAGGSGVLVARLPDGTWSPPSGILVHTLGFGFVLGIDIYDCVLVINSYEALKAFTTFRVTLGTEVSVVAGPVGAGGILESDIRPNLRPNNSRNQSRSGAQNDKVPLDPVQTELQLKAEREKRTRKPVFTYMKSRGLYAGLQVDGTFIVERNDENAKFYGERIGVEQILRNQVSNVPESTRMLMEVLKAAEGRPADAAMMNAAADVPPPSEIDIEQRHEPSHDQKVSFAPDTETKRQMDDMRSQGHDFPLYNARDFETTESDAALAARLQQEENARGNNIDNDIPPQQPPRPTASGKSASFIVPELTAASTDLHSAISPTASKYPNEKSAAYVTPRQPHHTETAQSTTSEKSPALITPHVTAASNSLYSATPPQKYSHPDEKSAAYLTSQQSHSTGPAVMSGGTGSSSVLGSTHGHQVTEAGAPVKPARPVSEFLPAYQEAAESNGGPPGRRSGESEKAPPAPTYR